MTTRLRFRVHATDFPRAFSQEGRKTCSNRPRQLVRSRQRVERHKRFVFQAAVVKLHCPAQGKVGLFGPLLLSGNGAASCVMPEEHLSNSSKRTQPGFGGGGQMSGRAFLHPSLFISVCNTWEDRGPSRLRFEIQSVC